MMSKLVSIIIPTYNYSQYIKEAIESALAQTYRPIEIIVVDDGSTDNTKDLLADYIRPKKINYIYQDNKGLAGARNAGLNASMGDYICLLDSDDLIPEKKIEIQVGCLEDNLEYGIAFSDYRFFRDDNLANLISPPILFSGDLTFQKIIRGEYMPVHATLIRRDVFEKVGYFNESLKRCEDQDFWIRAAMAGIRFSYIDQVLAYYRLHKEQMIQDTIDQLITHIEVISRYIGYDHKTVELAICKKGLWLGRLLIYNNRMEEGRKYLRKYMWYRKDKVIRMSIIILLSYIFSGNTIKKITDFK